MGGARNARHLHLKSSIYLGKFANSKEASASNASYITWLDWFGWTICLLSSRNRLQIQLAYSLCIPPTINLKKHDCHIFQWIVREYGLDQGQELNPEYLKAYMESHKVSEFIQINPLLKKFADSSNPLTFKFDIKSLLTLISSSFQ